ncbi:MAG: carbamoyltransferase HypF [Candidatus Hodarchaeales archaeon]|jgi:hydrogenase maturation protein HypF
MSKRVTWELIVEGSIQGVGFRPFIYRLALAENLSGEVQNKGNYVKILIQGPKESIKKFLSNLLLKKPPLAAIENITKKKIDQAITYSEFKIIQSQTDSTIRTSSYIPPDIAICDQCLDDMLRGDRTERKNYSFTSCVDCGPRFSVIRGIPYDRPLTTMDQFPLCSKCSQEYTNPIDRRFHAQTTCCRSCGPQYTLLDDSGSILESTEVNIVKKCQELLRKGSILAIKGIGGTHLACRADDPKIVQELRSRKGDRKRKPFALMSYSIEEIQKFAIIPNEITLEVLESPRRPIVLLSKTAENYLAENLAPNLHNIGVMLPYTGFHYQLLNHPKLKTIVMTSANRSHLPIQKDNEEILSSLTEVADFFVLHNREIHQRNDDSVIKPFVFTQHKPFHFLFLRRSRGYTPEPLKCPLYLKKSHLLGLGGELHTSPALITQGKLFLTQYIGNLRYQQTFDFYQQSIKHLQELLQNPPLKAIAHDLHPEFLSTNCAKELSIEMDIPIHAFQHHFAHGSALLADNQLWDEEAIIVTADGLGYGTDEQIWGGEILLCTLQEFERLDHLTYVAQPGGDLATKYPHRMLISHLLNAGKQENEILQLISKINSSTQGAQEKEVKIIIQQIQQKINSPLTSSTGRFLDTCSVALGMCSESTYEGEPAIVLEGKGWSARHTKTPNPFIKESLRFDYGLNFSPMIPLLIELIASNVPKNKLAWQIQEFVGWSFAKKILDYSHQKGITNLGFTGGVAYNDLIVHSFINTVKKDHPNIRILLHKNLPPGDGSIAAGQVILLTQKQEII